MGDQDWYWTEVWQAMEAEADRDLAEGRYKVFDSVEEFLRSLDDLERGTETMSDATI